MHFVHAICNNQQVWTQIFGELQGRVAGGSGRNMVKALLEKKGAQLAGFIRVPLHDERARLWGINGYFPLH